MCEVTHQAVESNASLTVSRLGFVLIAESITRPPGIYHPNVQYTNFFCSPPLPRRQVFRSSSGDMLVEKLGEFEGFDNMSVIHLINNKLETVTIEEQQCRPSRSGTSFVRTPSPPVRQVKIRSRPSSCYDLHNRESTGKQFREIFLNIPFEYSVRTSMH